MTNPNEHPKVKVGGLFHQPDYLAAYHKATRHLMQVGQIDELAMPILYLQRHTLELLLKTLRDGAEEAIQATQLIQKAKGLPVVPPFIAMNDKKHHRLGDLLTEAEAALSALGWQVPVPGLRELVLLCQSAEGDDETRWRYATGKKGQRSFPVGLSERRVELPVFEIQERLNQIAEDEQIGKTQDEVMKRDSISSYIWSLALENHQLDQELYSLGLL